ncbi:3-hydroxyisobutyrate dehydrogenase [Geobacillus subterraneus]|uniref:3-hydroxyisobutyrate dehydrogenase n=2 Tax=Geobacillus TaxID=129337 RepID=A0ABN4NMU7_9BACL|nr:MULTISPECIES: NAD(P)-dependent oxidoreductase [Geobacillus]AMX83770.1 3-hydroxyisobutyrate dehydrogenase [Geobacillus subterraneus]KZS25456.1 3-hydroxyisobutyrate dehydrogenase [Geobacillus subterraneus]OXB87984.1 3-hydroxyisobutyrate dehydrogenase [Geobacillus uzenensis]QIZ67608.1 NAD(P)-dependent oxidoreductase [Geobacillus subterraneus]
MTNVGFIGLGVMGSRMARRLVEAGFNVTVYNRTPEKAVPLVNLGARQAATVAELAGGAEVICTCLSMPDDVINVYTGEGGILDAARPGAVCLDFTTVGPKTSRLVAEWARQRGVSYLDAPVSGGPEGAEQGTLTMMVGGDQAAWERVRPLLSVLGKTVEYLGESGAGSAAKILNQYLVAVHSVAAAEAMAAGVAYGLDAGKLYRLLKESYGDSRMLRRHMEQFVLPRQFAPGGAVKYVHKDVRLANAFMNEIGINRCLGAEAEETFAAAMDAGLADLDMSAVIQLFERRVGVTVKETE